MTQENKTLLDWALYYRKLGWCVLPTGSNKRPLLPKWAKYQKEHPTDEEIQKWFTHPKTKGIAVVTGSISGVVVLDIDEGADTSGLTLPPTAVAKTGGNGTHRYFKITQGKSLKNSAGKIREHIDFRGDGGIAILPPSLHPSGNKYEWIEGLSPEEIEIADIPAWLVEQITSDNSQKQDFSKIVEGVAEGSRNQSAAVLAGKLLSYLPKKEWEATGWTIFLALNQNNKPPLPYRELADTFDSIKKLEERKKETGKAQEWIPPISISDLCKKDFPEQKWVVENIFETSTIGQLSAAPNQWKTWIMWHLAICIATGKPVFGKFNVSQQGVLIVNEEDPERMLKERSLMLLGEVEDVPVYIHAEKGVKLTDGKDKVEEEDEDREDIIDQLCREAEERKVGVIIFDSLSVVHSADENSAQQMGKVFEMMKRFTRRGITVLFTNHHRKRSLKGWEKDDLQEQVRGSTVINAVPSGHITCEERIQGEDKFVIIRQAKLKGAKKISPFLVRIKESEGKINFEYEGEHEESLGAATKLKNELYAIIQESGSWLGIKDLKDMVGKSEKPIREQIKALEKSGQIEPKTRSELIRLGIPVPERERASGQEFLYFKVDGVKEQDDLTTLVHPLKDVPK